MFYLHLCYILCAMVWVSATWNYLSEAIRTHPFNFFTLLLALTAVVVSVLAWRAARAQAESSRISTEAALRSASAAEESGKLAQQALELAQRPWVLIKEFKTKKAAPQMLPGAVVTTFVNTGPTPALHLTVHQDLHVSSESFPALPQFIEFSALASRGPLGPDGFFQLKTEIRLRPDQLTKIMAGEEYLYLYGVASYSDTFGKRRTTTWCLIYDNDPDFNDFTYFSANNTAD